MARNLIGTLLGHPHSGFFALADVRTIDQSWTKAAASTSGSFVDITGPNGAQLAGREGEHKKEKLPDGTWRIHATDAQNAEWLRNSVQSLVARSKWTDTVRILAKSASSTKVIDSTRMTGVGVLDDMIAIRAEKVEVYVESDDNGKPFRVVLELKEITK